MPHNPTPLHQGPLHIYRSCMIEYLCHRVVLRRKYRTGSFGVSACLSLGSAHCPFVQFSDVKHGEAYRQAAMFLILLATVQ